MRSFTAVFLILATTALATTASCSRKSEPQPAGEANAEAQPQARDAAEPAQPDPADLVSVELMAGVEHIAPGAPLELGARFTMAPGWHIYWENPGESGMQTRARFEAPGSVELGEVLYPGPIRFESPGNITSYGYSKEAVLFVRGEALDSATPGSELAFAVDTRWVACRDVCIVGTARAALTLPVRAEPPAPANQDTLAPHRRRLPRPWSELPGASFAWTDAKDHRVLAVRVPDAQAIELFPAADQPAVIARHTSRVEDGQGIVEIRYRGTARPSTPAGGVVRVETPTSTRYYRLEVPWS